MDEPEPVRIGIGLDGEERRLEVERVLPERLLIGDRADRARRAPSAHQPSRRTGSRSTITVAPMTMTKARTTHSMTRV